MTTTNPVSQVLVTSGNQAPLAAGARVDTLKNGQIGVFNVHTGLSVDGTVAGDCKEIFIAVGINRTLGGVNTAEDIQKSAGQSIQSPRVRAYTVKGYLPAVEKVVEVTGFKAKADTAYGLKIEFANVKSFQLNGYNPSVKTFNAHTSISGDEAITAGNNGELAQLLINNINLDTDKLVVASAFAYQISATVTAAATAAGNLTVTVGTETFVVAIASGDSTSVVAAKIAAAVNATTTSAYSASSAAAVVYFFPEVAAKTGSTTATVALTSAGGTGVTVGSITAANVNITNIDAFRAANPNAGIGIRITGLAETRPSAKNDINIKYHKTGTDFGVSLPYGFEVSGVVTVINEVRYPEGLGYDLKQEEYVAGGWNGKPGPYRQSESTGLARDGFEYFIDSTANYNQIDLGYDVKSISGFRNYESTLQTLIAIPCADTTTLTGLVGILDAAFSQFQPMANDVASMNCTNVKTESLAANVDGIESLS